MMILASEEKIILASEFENVINLGLQIFSIILFNMEQHKIEYKTL